VTESVSSNEKLLFAAAVPFEAACRVMSLPEQHRSRRLHGHSFLAKVRATLPAGWASFVGGEVDDLRLRLEQAVAPLDYRLLNELVAEPTDENLARWLRERMDISGLDTVGIQSTADGGADLDSGQHAHVWRRYALESAHRLPNVSREHKCGRMHGHSFQIILHADRDLGAAAMGIDYDALDALWAPFHTELDHACLNDIPGLENPTSEMICAWIWLRLKPQLPELSWVTVYETAQSGANFDGRSYRIWKEMTLDSSLVLHRAPEGDPRRRIHGHTYTLRLHINAPLDTVMGWTMDFGDVKDLFAPIFKRIDHHPLHELPGLAQADAASVAHWIWADTQRVLPQVDRIDLYERRGCGVILCSAAAHIALPL
jgi:6-pyruvoyltetrahydropterin/6-carboxytetrahydropterin synthase